jgi:hypothetical protein
MQSTGNQQQYNEATEDKSASPQDVKNTHNGIIHRCAITNCLQQQAPEL